MFVTIPFDHRSNNENSDVCTLFDDEEKVEEEENMPGTIQKSIVSDSTFSVGPGGEISGRESIRVSVGY